MIINNVNLLSETSLVVSIEQNIKHTILIAEDEDINYLFLEAILAKIYNLDSFKK